MNPIVVRFLCACRSAWQGSAGIANRYSPCVTSIDNEMRLPTAVRLLYIRTQCCCYLYSGACHAISGLQLYSARVSTHTISPTISLNLPPVLSPLFLPLCSQPPSLLPTSLPPSPGEKLPPFRPPLLHPALPSSTQHAFANDPSG